VKAAVFTAVDRVEIRDLPIPVPDQGQVRLKVLGCGVCGTDVHIYSGHIRNAAPPVVLGHEIYGEVDAVGKGVVAVEPGERVVVDPFVFCGYCDFCKQAKYQFCRNEAFLGYQRPGGFAQYTIVPAVNTYKLDPGIDIRQAVLAETLSTVLAGLSKLAPETGGTAMILGAGTVGLLWNVLMKKHLTVTLIQTELVNSRRSKARARGADRVINPSEEEPGNTVHELCPDGVDYLIDASGSTEAIEQALPLLARGGTFLSFGICPENQRLSLSLNWFYKQQIRFLTSRRPPREMQRAVNLIENKVLSIGDLTTGVYSLDELERAFERFTGARDEEIKMMIDPWR